MALDGTWLLGRWESAEPGAPHLTFDAGGDVRGSDGCNGIASAYVLTDRGAGIAPFLMTAMACAGVDQWLGAVRQVRRDGEGLVILDSEEREIGRLQRARE